MYPEFVCTDKDEVNKEIPEGCHFLDNIVVIIIIIIPISRDSCCVSQSVGDSAGHGAEYDMVQ